MFIKLFLGILLSTFAIVSYSADVAKPDFSIGLSISINDPSSAFFAAKVSGASSVRIDAPWAKIETVKGRYVFPPWFLNMLESMERNGLQPLIILDYGNPLYGITKPRTPSEITAFANYATWVVSNLKGRVKYFQLWNEWETKVGGGEPGTADEYLNLAKVVVPLIRQANPDAVILTSGISYPGLTQGWIDRFLDKGGMSLFDGLALHPYVFFTKKAWTPESSIRMVDDIYRKAVAKSDGKAIEVYITEFGYPEYDDKFGSNDIVASWYLERFMLLASSRSWIKGVWWYGLRDQGSNRKEKEHGFGLYDANLKPKTGMSAFRRTATVLKASPRGNVSCKDRLCIYTSANSETRISWQEDDLNASTRLGSLPSTEMQLKAYPEQPISLGN